MEMYEGLNSDYPLALYPTDAYGVLMICLVISGSIPIILCLAKRIHKQHYDKPVLPIYSTDTNIINNPNVKFRVNVADTQRPYLDL